MEAVKSPTTFASLRTSFQEAIDEYFVSGKVNQIIKLLKESSGGDSDKRIWLEQSIRDKYVSIWSKDCTDIEGFTKIITLCHELARNETLTPLFSVLILSDMFDTASISAAEKLFPILNDSLNVWKSEPFFTSCKNSILRMCNDLLRRLPRSQNTKFCGQVLLFLALFFPFSERSGLNIISEFNSENVTKFSPNSDSKMENEIIKEIIPEALVSKVDNEFYSKFWGLQEFFRNPNLCYDESKWKDFTENTGNVLKLIGLCKTASKPGKEESDKAVKQEVRRMRKCESFNNKYLTDPRLLIFQLDDSNFRKAFFLQYLILFQYLKSYVKSRPDSYDLKAEQLEWVKSTTNTICKLCKESSADGAHFLQCVTLILEHENQWNKWKNESCPAIKKKAVKESSVLKEAKPLGQVELATSLSDSVRQAASTNLVVTCLKGKERSWKLQGDYLTQSLNFTKHPDLKERIEEIVSQSDPKSMIEPAYKKVNDMKYSWQTLKLYHQKAASRYFSMPSVSNPDKIPKYLENLSGIMNRDDKAVKARLRKEAGDRSKQSDSAKRSSEGDDESKPERDVRMKKDDLDDSKDFIEKEEEEKMDVEQEEEMEMEASTENLGEDEDESEDDEEEDEEAEDGEDASSDYSSESETSPHHNGEYEDGEGKSKQNLSKEELEQIAKEMEKDWKSVAAKLSYKPDEIEYFENEEEDDYSRAFHMLDVWFDNEENASAETLKDCFDSLNMTAASEMVKKFSQ